MFAGIFQKQRQGCSLLGVDQLLHIAEIHFGFSKRKAIFAVNLGFQFSGCPGRLWRDGATLALVMMRWLSGRRNVGASMSERGYS